MTIDDKVKEFKVIIAQPCIYIVVAKSQRAEEVARGEGLSGTEGFQQMGCYKCDSYKIGCTAYIPQINDE